jgi:hypothetical protein
MLEHCADLGLEELASVVRTQCLPEQSRRWTSTIAHGSFPSRQCEWPKRCDTLEAVLIYRKEFSSPNSSIRAETRAIPRHAEVGSFQTIFGGAPRDVGLMVEDSHQGHTSFPCVLLSPLGGGIIGVKITSDYLGAESIEFAEIVYGSLERLSSLGRVEIADMLAQPHLLAEPDCDGVLEMASDGKHRTQVERNYHWQRSIPASAA